MCNIDVIYHFVSAFLLFNHTYFVHIEANTETLQLKRCQLRSSHVLASIAPSIFDFFVQRLITKHRPPCSTIENQTRFFTEQHISIARGFVGYRHKDSGLLTNRNRDWNLSCCEKSILGSIEFIRAQAKCLEKRNTQAHYICTIYISLNCRI